MNFIDAIKSCYGSYATFSGRATRKEFWYFNLYAALVTGIFAAIAVAIISSGAIGASVLGFGGGSAGDVALTAGSSFVLLLITVLAFGAWALGSLLPYIAVNVRRLRDAGFSGWFVLLHLLPFGSTATYILCVFPSRNKLFIALPGDGGRTAPEVNYDYSQSSSSDSSGSLF